MSAAPAQAAFEGFDAYDFQMRGGATTAAFSGSNGLLAFATNRDGGARELYKMGADGSSPTRLTNNSGFDEQPAWSPDGTQIAFRTELEGNAEIYTMNAADGSSQTDRSMANGSAESQPAWSPNGTQIAFHTNRDSRGPGLRGGRLVASAAVEKRPAGLSR